MSDTDNQLPLRITTFGGLDIRLEGQTLTGLSSRKAEALLAEFELAGS